MKFNYLTFGEAIELAKKGQPVSASTWDFVDRLTGISTTMVVKPEQIWLPENRRMAELMGKGTVPVRPYLTRMTREGILNQCFTNEDVYANWLPADVTNRCSYIGYSESDPETLVLRTELFNVDHAIRFDTPFWMVYEQQMLGYHNNYYFIGGCVSDNIINATIMNLLSQNLDNRSSPSVVNEIGIDNWFLKDGWRDDVCNEDALRYRFIQLDELDYDFDFWFEDVNKPVSIFVDARSLNQLNLKNGENAIEHVTSVLAKLTQFNPLLNWVVIDREGIIDDCKIALERQKAEASADETFALKAD